MVALEHIQRSDHLNRPGVVVEEIAQRLRDAGAAEHVAADRSVSQNGAFDVRALSRL